MEKKKQTSLKIGTDFVLSEHENLILNEKKELIPIKEDHEYFALYKILARNVWLNLSNIPNIKSILCSDLNIIITMKTIEYILQNQGKNIIEFRDAVFGRSASGEQLSGKEAKKKCAELSEVIRRNLTEDQIDGEPTAKAIMEAETAILVQDMKEAVKNKAHAFDLIAYIQGCLNSELRCSMLLLLSEKYYPAYLLQDLCREYEEKHSVKESDDIYSLEQLYSINPNDPNKIFLDMVLDEVLSTLGPSILDVNMLFTSRYKLKLRFVSPDHLKLFRSINYHREAILAEQRWFFQMFRFGRKETAPKSSSRILDRIVNRYKAAPSRVKIFRRSVNQTILEIFLCKDKAAEKEKLCSEERALDKEIEEVQAKLKESNTTEQAGELEVQIESCNARKAEISEALDALNSYERLAPAQKEVIKRRLVGDMERLDVKFRDADALNNFMPAHEKAENEQEVAPVDDKVPEENTPSAMPVDDKVPEDHALDFGANGSVELPVDTKVNAGEIPANPESIDQSFLFKNNLQVIMGLFFGLLVVISFVLVYTEMGNQICFWRRHSFS
ncbi:uncharacterized protein NEMAJ01_1870 [Nematocida major]|uniref:uncharacterized protein n=1 Tax=Nematocida major TaxID=1912982 RepID=UPI002007B5D4|nr:uncharacterized protein NEMAJ01_1870 [Nematocida major]KAH9386974.1 hypothetical protein NEMAJ01_1870 [Nematocida major]